MEQIQKRLGEFKQKQKGFTLVELIVVIAIIGILAAVMLPKYFGFTSDARKAAVVSEAKSLRSVAETYYANNDKWPAITAGASNSIGGQTFTGTVSVIDTPFDGSFTYAIGTHHAICDNNGNVSSVD